MGERGTMVHGFYIDDFRQSDAANGTEWNGPFQGHLTVDDDGNDAIPYEYYAFSFYGDRAVSYIADDLTFKQFDSVPKLAEALTISNDRVFMGNYVEGFDRPNVNADITYEPTPRPDDFASIDISLIPEVRAFENQTGGVKNRTVGYRLDMSQVQNTFAAGSTININITLTPDNNIHLYNSKSSFHASSFFTHNVPSNPSLLRDRFNNFDDPDLVAEYMVDPNWNATKAYFNKTDLDIKNFEGQTFTDFHDLGWDPMAGYPGATRNQNSATWVNARTETTGALYGKSVLYGSSAANPLILSGGL